MAVQNLLQRAILEARAGREQTARELFLEVVELEPQNALAWMWLTGLLEEPAARQEACRRVLALDPANRAAQAYLEKLIREEGQAARENTIQREQKLKQAGRLAKTGRRQEALALVQQVTAQELNNLRAWRLLARLSTNLDEQIQALQQAVRLRPQDLRLRAELRQKLHYRSHPQALAKLFEEQGNFAQALAVYKRMGASARTSEEWDRVYHNVTRLEAQQREGIRFVHPSLSVLRLAAGPPLLYAALMWLQIGIDPFADFEALPWLGLPLAMLGGWLTALAGVRGRHRVWLTVFQDEDAGGSPLARFLLGALGWLVVLLPHLFLLADSYRRLASLGALAP